MTRIFVIIGGGGDKVDVLKGFFWHSRFLLQSLYRVKRSDALRWFKKEIFLRTSGRILPFLPFLWRKGGRILLIFILRVIDRLTSCARVIYEMQCEVW